MDDTTLNTLESWIGRSKTLHSELPVFAAQALAGAINHAEAPGPGDELPLPWHWLYFLDPTRRDNTGEDGHPRKGGFLPPVPLPRRMWAAGTLNIAQPLILGLATEKVSSFHSDGIDLAVRQGSPPFGASLEVTQLFKQKLIAVASSKLAGNRNLRMDPETLSELPKIHDTHDLWRSYLAHFGLQDRAPRSLRLSQTSLAVDAAIAGQGVALVSRFLVTHDLEAGRLVEVGEMWEAGGNDFYVLVPRAARNSGAVAEVLAWLKARSAEDN